MANDVRIPVTIRGAVFTELLVPGRTGFHLPPVGAWEGDVQVAFQVREWPLGDIGTLGTTDRGELIHLDVATAREHDKPLAEPQVAREVDHVTTRLAFGASATLVSGAPDADDRQLRMVTIGDTPERWLRLAPSGVLVGLRGEDELAGLAFHTRVRRPVERRVLLRAGTGWTADTMQWFAGDGTAEGTSVQLHRPFPQVDDPSTWQHEPMPAPTDYEHEPSLDLAANIVFMDGAFEHLDARVLDGAIAMPSTVVEMDELEVQLTWPAVSVTGTLDRDAGLCQIELCSGEPVHWAAVGDGLLAGVDSAGVLVALIATNVTIQPAFDHPMRHMSFDPADQAANMQMMTEQMQEQSARERVAAAAFAEAPTLVALGPVNAPDTGPRSMRLIDGASPGHVIGIELIWGDEMGAVLPGGDFSAPITLVRHGRPHFAPAELPVFHDEHFAWLEGLRMQRAHAAMQAGEPDIELQALEESSVFGVDEHHRRIAELAALAHPTTLSVDGDELAATWVLTEHGYVVRAERDGFEIVLRSTRVDEPVPRLTVVEELEPFVTGMAEQQERMRAWHLEMAAQIAQQPAAPVEPVAARTAAQELVSGLQFSDAMMGGGFPGAPVSVDPVDAFTTDIISSWGGVEAFRQQFGLLQRLTSVSGSVGNVARDGSVAQATMHINLPRPDGIGFGFAMAIESEWWDHDPEEIRSAAIRQLDPEQQGEYEFQFNALVERQDDGSYRIATDLLRLVDEHVGGLEQLL